ncbi:hypothetical protein D9M68_597460 [compost metagenome]
MQVGLAAQPVQRFAQRARQRVRRQVGVALHLGLGLDLVLHAQVTASQRHGHGHVGVGVGADDAVFHPARGRAGDRRADAHRAVVVAPLDVDRRGRVAREAAVAVHVRRHQHHGSRDVALQATDVVVEGFGRRAIVVAEDVLAGLLVQDALVHVHGRAGLAGDRLGHEGGVHVVAQRRFAHRALEEEHLVGQAQRVGVEEVDLHLPRAHLVDQRVHVELHLVAVVVDLLEQRVEFVHRVDAVGLPRGFGAAAAADRRLEQRVRVGVARGQVELQLGRDHRVQALGVEQLTHVAQHAARREGHQLAVVVEAVVDHLRGGVGGPGHDARGGRVRAQLHVAVGRLDHVVVRPAGRKLPRHPHRHDRLRQAHAAVLGELLTRQDLAARHAGQVGHQALDLGHAVLVEPVLQIVEGHFFVSGCHVPSPAVCCVKSIWGNNQAPGWAALRARSAACRRRLWRERQARPKASKMAA